MLSIQLLLQCAIKLLGYEHHMNDIYIIINLTVKSVFKRHPFVVYYLIEDVSREQFSILFMFSVCMPKPTP